MFKTQQEVHQAYENLISHTETAVQRLDKIVNRYSIYRLLLLLVEVVFLIAFLSSKNESAALFTGWALLLPVLVFVVVVRKQAHFSYTLNDQRNLLWIYRNEMQVGSGEENGYDQGLFFEDEDHPYTADLDIFGRGSLFAWINRCGTKRGIMKLARHLSSGSEKDDIMARQQAILEMQSHIWDTFKFRARLRGHELNKMEDIKAKLTGQFHSQLEFIRNSWLRIYVKLAPYLSLLLLLGGLLAGGSYWSGLSLFAFINGLIVFYYLKRINQVYLGFSGQALLLADYAKAMEWMEGIRWESPYIKAFFTNGEKASMAIVRLSKIIQAFDARLNFLLAAVLNFFLLWDIRCTIKIADWQQQDGHKVTAGLDRIGDMEELIALATLSHNEPAWVLPLIEDSFCLSVEAIGHPLIRAEKRVTNSFYMDTQPVVDIITGSNMAGKSTFLRTIGINMVLAFAGARVCATRMQVSLFSLFTYMRIKDSLQESTSTFKAELNRLRMILGQAPQCPGAFILIDEMLRGTNSQDKFTGSKVFIEKLLMLKIPALFATHDLQLSMLSQAYPQTVRNFHFDIQLSGNQMKFDYKLKTGPCNVFNAAFLLKEIGLPMPEGSNSVAD